MRQLPVTEIPSRYEPPRSDYPVRLLTRRTFGLQSDGIVESRRTAPVGVKVDRRALNLRYSPG